LGRTEDDVDVKKAVDKAQAYYNVQEKQEWVEWAGKILMPRLHAQMAMEQADAMRAVQEDLDKMRRQDEREQRAEKRQSGRRGRRSSSGRWTRRRLMMSGSGSS
jgi:hypothetical protein